MATKSKQTKLITQIQNALKDAGIKVKRDGWQENNASVPPNDNCEWLDIYLNKGKSKKKHIIHMYFSQNSNVLDTVEVWKGKGGDARMVAGTSRPDRPKPKTDREAELEKMMGELGAMSDEDFNKHMNEVGKIFKKKKGKTNSALSGFQVYTAIG